MMATSDGDNLLSQDEDSKEYPFSLTDIVNYLQVIRCENDKRELVMSAGRVIACQQILHAGLLEKTNNYISVRAFVLPSSRQAITGYQVELTIFKSRALTTFSMSCSCKARNNCKHGVALMIYTYQISDRLKLITPEEAEAWSTNKVSQKCQICGAVEEYSPELSREESIDRMLMSESEDEVEYLARCLQDSESNKNSIFSVPDF